MEVFNQTEDDKPNNLDKIVNIWLIIIFITACIVIELS